MDKKPEITKGTDILSLVGKYRKLIMGFAAIYILIFHEYQILFDPGTPIYEFQRYIKTFGFMGVDIFFLLSGIGLTYSIHKSSLGSFYYKRLRRIVFPFVCVGIIRAFMEQWPADVFWGSITGYNFWMKSMYSFLWFVPAIAAFYIVFPLYNKIIEKFENKVTFTFVIICIWLLLSMLFADKMTEIGRQEFFGFTNRIPIFVLGVMFGHLAQSRRLIVDKLGWILIILVNALGLYLAVQTNFKGWFILVPVSNCCIPNMLMSISLTFILAKVFDWISKFGVYKIVKGFFGFFGMISLEFYCIQEFLTGRILPYIANENPFVKNLIIFAAVTAAAAAIYYAEFGFWKLVELPVKLSKKNTKE